MVVPLQILALPFGQAGWLGTRRRASSSRSCMGGDSSARIPEIRACFDRLDALHCSAGLHRTGMITYAFLRHLGHSRAEALALIAELRQATADAATESRLAWGDQFAAR